MITIGGSWDPYTRLVETIKNIQYLQSLSIGDEAVFEPSGFVRPISIAPIALVGFDKLLSFSNFPDYCLSMEFPHGQEISGYTTDRGTYVPLTRADLYGLSIIEREKKLRELSDKYLDLLQRNIITDQEFLERIGQNVSAMLISEMVDNIIEHSDATTAFIHSQYWKGNNSCEICLVDNGMGIYQSLAGANRKVSNDIDALRKVIVEHLSSKDEGGSQRRGTGIKNTINLLSNNELNGYFCVISGKAGYFIDNNRERFLNLQSINWNGTLINMGFQKPQNHVNIYDHIR